MSRSLSWRSVTGGIVALVVLIAVSLIVLVYGRIGIVRGQKFDLYVAADEANGIAKGSDVWLAGRRVGLVEEITFRSPDTPLGERLILRLAVTEEVRPLIRLDSRAEIGTGGTAIGTPVMNIQPGTPATRGVVPGDTLRIRVTVDVGAEGAKFAAATKELLPAIMSDAKFIAARAKQAQARAGSMMDGPTMDQLRANSGRLMSRVREPRGTVGAALSGRGTLMLRAKHAMAGVDSVRALLAGTAERYGRFRRDSTLILAVSGLRADLDELRTLAASEHGTIGRLRADSALFAGVDSARAQMALLMADIKQNPRRYIYVF